MRNLQACLTKAFKFYNIFSILCHFQRDNLLIVDFYNNCPFIFPEFAINKSLVISIITEKNAFFCIF